MNSISDNISFLLVEPFLGGNIGASARALKNMGFNKLELLNPNVHLNDEAYAFAHGARDVLESAIVYTSFEQAISGKSIVVAVSRRLGKTRGMILPIKEGAKRIVEFASSNKVVIVFGREDKGLLNEEVDRCGFVITIPTDVSQPSLNLAQSVMLIAYEISQIDKCDHSSPILAPQKELIGLYSHINETLKLLDYGMRGSEDLEADIMRNISHLIGRYGLTDWEVKMLHGLCGRIKRTVVK
ncbi:MAG: RNA methyltransferase [Nitrospirae bacterium]|nr:RNA methyltransferase [Nitrospirota bacterium]MBF0541821.1 RNA methyltransferase [Nitrospirota bacterium]